jgi:hypothetical protein
MGHAMVMMGEIAIVDASDPHNVVLPYGLV